MLPVSVPIIFPPLLGEGGGLGLGYFVDPGEVVALGLFVKGGNEIDIHKGGTLADYF
jgi:hypothetical protein